MQLPYGKVHTIDDENYVYTLMNRSVPISLDLSDDLWGAVKIESIEEILEYYEMLYKLPVTTEAGKKSGSPRRTVSGVIQRIVILCGMESCTAMNSRSIRSLP